MKPELKHRIQRRKARGRLARRQALRESYKPEPRRSVQRLNRQPTLDEIEAIPIVAAAEFDLSERETAKLRRRLYAINREARGVRYRTLRDGSLVLVWGIRR